MSRKTIDPEKKFEAVMDVLRGKEPLSIVARRYGMSEQSLRNAKEQFLSAGKEGLKHRIANPHEREVDRLSKELAERDRVIGEITIANRILKKKVDGFL